MNKKTLGIIAAVVGIIVLLVSLLANQLGLGSPGFGIKQIIGTVLGAVVAILGIVLATKGAPKQ
jgi:uncharacterized RDD family membrane protein YckC